MLYILRESIQQIVEAHPLTEMPHYCWGRLAAVGEWSDGKHGEATGHINDSKRLFGTAYGAGLMSHASKSLSERVEADRVRTHTPPVSRAHPPPVAA